MISTVTFCVKAYFLRNHQFLAPLFCIDLFRKSQRWNHLYDIFSCWRIQFYLHIYGYYTEEKSISFKRISWRCARRIVIFYGICQIINRIWMIFQHIFFDISFIRIISTVLSTWVLLMKKESRIPFSFSVLLLFILYECRNYSTQCILAFASRLFCIVCSLEY